MFQKGDIEVDDDDQPESDAEEEMGEGDESDDDDQGEEEEEEDQSGGEEEEGMEDVEEEEDYEGEEVWKSSGLKVLQFGRDQLFYTKFSFDCDTSKYVIRGYPGLLTGLNNI